MITFNGQWQKLDANNFKIEHKHILTRCLDNQRRDQDRNVIIYKCIHQINLAITNIYYSINVLNLFFSMKLFKHTIASIIRY